MCNTWLSPPSLFAGVTMRAQKCCCLFCWERQCVVEGSGKKERFSFRREMSLNGCVCAFACVCVCVCVGRCVYRLIVLLLGK